MTEPFALSPCPGPLNAQIQPPGSKSLTNRALICAALANGPSQLQGALWSEDTLVMVTALQQLGIQIDWSEDRQTLQVGGRPSTPLADQVEFDIANSGTTIRFLTSLLSTLHGHYRLDGTARMRERPIADLLKALSQLGGKASSVNNDGCPPILVEGQGLGGGSCSLKGDISSQFLSGLLLAAPHAEGEITLQLETPLVSAPYVAMTQAVMESFGVNALSDEEGCYRVPGGQNYNGGHYDIEPDASAASYFWAAAAIAGGQVTVPGLSRQALQGDVAFCKCLESMGCKIDYHDEGITVHGAPLQGIEVDMNPISDTVQTLAVVALFASGPTTITGVAHIRHKESDRIGDLARELRKLGAVIDEHPDGLTIHPRSMNGTLLETYQDHRMAMSLALAGLKVPGVTIQDPQCTEKTYPRYFEDLQAVLASTNRNPDR